MEGKAVLQQNNNSPRRKKMSFTMKDAYSVMLREYPDVMNIEQMSQALGVSTKTGYGLLKSGEVACLKVGRAYRIPKAWCEMRGVTVTSEIKRFVMSELDKYYAELDRLHEEEMKIDFGYPPLSLIYI